MVLLAAAGGGGALLIVSLMMTMSSSDLSSGASVFMSSCLSSPRILKSFLGDMSLSGVPVPAVSDSLLAGHWSR